MLKHGSRSRMNSVKKKALEKSILQDMNFLSLKEFYNSIPDYSEINHLPEREFYREIDILKRKQQQLTECKKASKCKPKSDKSSSRSSHHFDFALPNNEFETKRNYTERISFADDGNSISSWQLEYDGVVTCKKRDQPSGSRLSSAASRPRTSRAESRCRKQQSRLSNVLDDYETLNSLRNCRSKSTSPVRSRKQQHPKQVTTTMTNATEGEAEDENKFYSDITQDKLKSVDHAVKKDPMKSIPITSKIPLFKQVMEDMEHKSHLAKLDSAIKLQSQMKPFHFHETRSVAKRCLSRSRSTPQLRGPDDSEHEDAEEEDEAAAGCPFKAKPFPKNLFCNYFHYKMWEDNYFRALSKKLRAEELMKLSKLPPSMAKRHEEKKKSEKLDELELAQLEAAAVVAAKQNVDFSPTVKKKKFRKKLRKSKSAIGGTRTQFAKSYIFDMKRDRDKGSVKSDATTTTNTTRHHRGETPSEKISPSPIYPVNRPNLAATLRYEWSREKLKHYKEVKENMMRDKFRKPSWGVKSMHAFQQLAHETTNDEEIAIRLATRKAEQKLRQEEHEMNMEMMKQRVKTAPLLLEGPTQLAPRLGHIYHHCDIASDKSRFEKLMQQNNHLLKPPSLHHHLHHHHKGNRPGSTLSTDSKVTESTYNTKCTET